MQSFHGDGYGVSKNYKELPHEESNSKTILVFRMPILVEGKFNQLNCIKNNYKPSLSGKLHPISCLVTNTPRECKHTLLMMPGIAWQSAYVLNLHILFRL